MGFKVKRLFDTDGFSLKEKIYNIFFNTSTTAPTQYGEMSWDADSGTLAVGLEHGVALQLGQENYIRGKNISGSTILNGQVVYIDGASGNRPTINKANASSDLSKKTIAMATEDITNNNNGYCTTTGIVRDINTSAWNEGDLLYLSDTIDGGVTNIKPSKPSYCVCIGVVIRDSTTEGQIFVSIGYLPKVKDLSDVIADVPTNGNYLYWDSVTSTWKLIEAGFNAVSRWEDIIIPIEGLGAGASAPDIVTFLGSTRVYAFDGNVTSEMLYGSIEMPHNYKEHTDLRPHIHFAPLANATGNVKWSLEYTIASKDTVFSTPTTINSVYTCTNKLNTHLAYEFDVIVGTNIHIGDIIIFRLFRNPTDAQDTFGSDVGLVSLGVHHEIDGDGSRNVFSK